jgi:RimJ/RimL family protein N-acetyltransferase
LEIEPRGRSCEGIFGRNLGSRVTEERLGEASSRAPERPSTSSRDVRRVALGAGIDVSRVRVTIGAMFDDGLPTLEGARIRLRALHSRDAADVFALYHDRETTRFGYAPKMASLADASRLIEEIADLASRGALWHFGVADRDEDRVIGHVTLFEWKREHRRAEVGYSITRSRWGQGLGREAVRLLIGCAFERCDLRRLEADVEPRNVRSLRLLEALGFRREGLLRARWEQAGELQDSIVLGLLREDWRGS